MKNAAIRVCLCLLPLSGAAVAAGQVPDAPRDYRIVPEESEIDVLVFRAGALGRFGHNHVVTVHNLSGHVHVAQSPAECTLELSVPVEALAVDAPEARAAAGSAFASEMSDDDRAGTRHNMLGPKLLDGERFPEVHVRSQGIEGGFEDMTVTAEIDIHGEQRTVELPVSTTFSGDRLVATGSTELTHADLGLEPFSAGFGTLRVAEDLRFRYRIVAVAEATGETSSDGERTPSVVEHDDAALAHRAAE